MNTKYLSQSREGCIGVYHHHNGRIVAIVELTCETDFVARTAEFRDVAHGLAMQVAAMAPETIDDLLVQESIHVKGEPVSAVVDRLRERVKETIVIRHIARFEI